MFSVIFGEIEEGKTDSEQIKKVSFSCATVEHIGVTCGPTFDLYNNSVFLFLCSLSSCSSGKEFRRKISVVRYLDHFFPISLSSIAFN